MEVLTFSLCSQDENYAKLRQADDGQAVVLANPATQVGLRKALIDERNIIIFRVSHD